MGDGDGGRAGAVVCRGRFRQGKNVAMGSGWGVSVREYDARRPSPAEPVQGRYGKNTRAGQARVEQLLSFPRAAATIGSRSLGTFGIQWQITPKEICSRSSVFGTCASEKYLRGF